MTQFSTERLYQLLPAIYRIRDEEVGGEPLRKLPAIYRIRDEEVGGEPLRKLLGVLEEELEFLETDIDDLYDNWFIETCEDWVVPYIGDLLGVRELYPERATRRGDAPVLAPHSTHGQLQRRAFVANILAYRRRKGTVPAMEQLARDITGWPARAVEFWRLVAATANLDRASGNSTVSLRPRDCPELLGTPFEGQAAYSAEVRRIASSGGRYNLPNLGLFLWRLSSYPWERVTAFLVPSSQLPPELQGRCYTFSPLGLDSPLFNRPQTETEIVQLASEINVPGILPTRSNYEGYSGSEPVFQIFINGQPRPIPPEEVLIAPLAPASGEDKDKTKWQIPSDSSGTKVVAVDPARGRLAFLERNLPSRVEVSYTSGFSGDIGGGPYERMDSIPQWLQLPQFKQPIPSLTWEVNPTSSAHPNPLAEVIQMWNGTVLAWQGIRQRTCLPLACLSTTPPTLPPPNLIIKPLQGQSQFQAGILSGLEVITEIGLGEVLLTSGVAVDAQGRTILLDRNYSVKLAEQNLNLSPLPSQEVLLVIAYCSAREGENYSVRALLPAEVAEDTADRYLVLAKLRVDPLLKILAAPDLDSRPVFKAGIVSGFQVVTNPGTIEAIVTPGTAVDGQGRRMELDHNVAITAADLSKYANQSRLLLLSHSATATVNWQLQQVAEGEANRYPETIYLRLAKLEIPEVTARILQQDIPRFRQGIVSGLVLTAAVGTREVKVAAGVAANAKGQQITLEDDYQVPSLWRYCNQSVIVALFPKGKQLTVPPLLTGEGLGERSKGGRILILQAGQEKKYPDCLPLTKLTLDGAGKVTASPIHLAQQFAAGIVEGLTVTTAGQAQVIVSAGRAVDGQGQPIILEQECQVDLSAHQGRNFILFISQQRGMGWRQLTVTRHGTGRQWQQLGAVPQEQSTDKSGIILIRDNRTYEGNLEIEIPAGRQLQILAANGYRPHIRGEVSVQCSNPPIIEEEKPSQLRVDGLLIEGTLTVAAGFLQKLRIAHCTLVPDRVSLIVKKTESVSEPEQEEEEWFLIALSIYYFNLIQQLIRLGFTADGLSPQQRLEQFVQVACRELERFFSGCQQVISQWQNGEEADGDGFCQCLQPTPSSLPGADNADLSLEIDRSICGPIHLAETVPQLAIADSIIDKGPRLEAPRPIAILAWGTEVKLGTTTVLGMTAVGKISASDCLFGERVAVRRRQEGCLRFCLVPDGSETPRRYQCQPDLLLKEELHHLPAAITYLAIYESVIIVGTAGDGIFRSEDNGKSWHQLDTDLKEQHITCLIAYNKSASETIILAGTAGNGILYSKDNGNNWLPTKLMQKNIQALARIPGSDRLLVGTPEGVFSATDVGGDWSSFGEQKLNATALLVTASGDIFAGTTNGIFRFSLETANWQAVKRGLIDREVTVLGSSVEEEIFAGTEGGSVFRSRDKGETWELMTPDWMNWPVTSLAINNSKIFIGTAGGGIFCSLDGGKNWQQVNHDWTSLTVTTLAINVNTGEIWAGTAAGNLLRLIHSADSEMTWQAVNNIATDVEKKLLLLNRLHPTFTSRNYGDPGYAQLSQSCAREIRTGAEDGSEMGAFNYLNQPQREASLKNSLQEYLPFGMEAGIFYLT